MVQVANYLLTLETIPTEVSLASIVVKLRDIPPLQFLASNRFSASEFSLAFCNFLSILHLVLVIQNSLVRSTFSIKRFRAKNMYIDALTSKVLVSR